MWKEIKKIIEKVERGEALNDDEKAKLAAYREPQPDAALKEQIATLQAEKEALENAGKPEVEQLKAANAKLQTQVETLSGQVAAITKERDDVTAAKSAMEFESGVTKLAAEHRFTDPDFLKYKLQSGSIDLADEAAVKGFMEQMKTANPKFFAASVNPGGGGTGGGAGEHNRTAPEPTTRIDKLAAQIGRATVI